MSFYLNYYKLLFKLFILPAPTMHQPTTFPQEVPSIVMGNAKHNTPALEMGKK